MPAVKKAIFLFVKPALRFLKVSVILLTINTNKFLVKPNSTMQSPGNCGRQVWLHFSSTNPTLNPSWPRVCGQEEGREQEEIHTSLLKWRGSKRQNNVSQTCFAAHTSAISSHTALVFIWLPACNCFSSSLLHDLIWSTYWSIIRASGNHKSGPSVSSTQKW